MADVTPEEFRAWRWAVEDVLRGICAALIKSGAVPKQYLEHEFELSLYAANVLQETEAKAGRYFFFRDIEVQTGMLTRLCKAVKDFDEQRLREQRLLDEQRRQLNALMSDTTQQKH